MSPIYPIHFASLFRSLEKGGEDLSPPSGFAFTPEGDLIVADDFNHRIQIYDPERGLKACFGSKGRNDGEFMYPRGIATDPDGNIYVADSWNHRVQKFDASGKHLSSFGGYGEDKGQLNEPYDVHVASAGEIVVVERYNHRIQFFRPDGSSLGWVGMRGTVLEEHLALIYETPPHLLSRPVFEFPTSITRDSRHNFYIADSANHRIVKFDSEWNETLSFGRQGSGPGEFKYPLCVAAGPNDLLYVADLNNDRVQVFTSQGRFLQEIKEGNASTPSLKTPCLTKVDSRGRLFVGLTFNSAVLEFRTAEVSQESVYENLIEQSGKDYQAFHHQGRFFEDSGNSERAAEAYTQAVRLLLAENGGSGTAGRPDSDSALALPLRLSRLLAACRGGASHEALLLSCLAFYDDATNDLYRNVLEQKTQWDTAIQVAVRRRVAEENLILEQKDNPLSFNKELYQAETEERKLFREMRGLFYRCRRASEQAAEFVETLWSQDLSPTGRAACLQRLQSRYRNICGHISFLLKDKESKEEEMLDAFSKLQDDTEKWENFRAQLMVNTRTLDTLKILLYELRSLLKNIKSAALNFSSDPQTRQTLAEMAVAPPEALRLPEILLSFQEDWAEYTRLNADLGDLVDAWISGKDLSKEEPTAVQLHDDYFSPVAYDQENLDPGDVVRNLLIEDMPLEKAGQSCLCGHAVYSLNPGDGERFPRKLEDILRNHFVYEEKIAELFQNYREFSDHRPELESKLRQVDIRDKGAPIPIANNIMVNDFQASLLRRMILTLEINEMNNLVKLVVGGALLACREGGTESVSEKRLFDKLRSLRSELAEKIRDGLRQKKTLQVKALELEEKLRNASNQPDPAGIESFLETKKTLAKEILRHDQLNSTLNRRIRTKKLLDKWSRLVPGEEQDARSSFAKPLELKFKRSFGTLGWDKGNFVEPTGVAHTPEGDLLVTDKFKQQVQRFAPSGFYRSSFGRWGNGPGAFNSPAGIQTDSSGNIYTAVSLNRRIQKFSPEGKFLSAFGDQGALENRLGRVVSLSVDKENNIWAADTERHRIQVYRPNGERLRTLGGPGKEPQNLFEPTAICCLEDGGYAVADGSEYRIKRFDAEGRLLHVLKNGQRELDDIYFMVSDPKHGIFAADTWNCRIIHLNSNLDILAAYFSPGKRAGEFGKVCGLSISRDTLAAVDLENQRVMIFELPVPETDGGN